MAPGAGSMPGLDRHAEGDAGVVAVGQDLDRAVMRFGNLRGNVEAQAQSLQTGFGAATMEGLEQPFHGMGGYRRAGIGDREQEVILVDPRFD